MPDNGPVLLFDGVCNLCSATVQFIIARDRNANIRFASLQSDFAVKQLFEWRPHSQHLDGIVLLEGSRTSDRSTAALRLSKYMDGAWPILGVLLIIPRPLRDLIYDIVARNRYRWFGKKEICWIPSQEMKARFIEP